MNKIPAINIREYYQAELDSAKGDEYFAGSDLKKLMEDLENEDNPVDFKEQLLAINQLYFEGILEEHSQDEWDAQSKALEKLILAGKNAIGSFYDGNGTDFDSTKEIVLPYADKLIKYGNTSCNANGRRDLRQHENDTQKFGLELQKAFDNPKFIDTIICVASGAFEPSFLAMHIIEKDELTVVRYSHINKYDSDIKIPKCFPKEYINSKIEDKKVLIAEDFIASGKTIKKVLSFVSALNPDELYCISVLGRSRNSESANRMEFLKTSRPSICRYHFESCY